MNIIDIYGIEPMPYPSRFRKKKRLPNLVRTDKMTGVLGDPFDPKPWLEINTTESQEDPQPKTLIFADPVYASRSIYAKSDIIENLREAKSAGFNILIMEPDQTLTVWDYSPIPTHYKAGYYSQETINYLAYTQHKLASEDILTLDYAGLNDLENKTGRMKWSEFRDISEDYFKIINESKQHDLRLVISTNDFIKKLKERKPQELPQVKELILELTPTDAEFETLFQHYQYIEKLHLEKCSNIAGTLKKFPQQFKQLNFLSLNSSKLSSDELIQLLQATPSLSHLELRGCDIVLDEKVILPVIKNLKKFTVTGGDSSRTFSSILQAASSGLEDIELRGVYDLSDLMTVLTSSKFPRLKNINMLERFHPTKENLAALFTAAPFLENLTIKKWPALGSWNLKPNQLPHLKNITLMESNLSTHDLHALLNAAPQIEELNLKNNNLSGLNKFSFPSLSKLKKLNLESTSISADDLLTLLTSATNLEELNIQDCKNLSNVKNHLGDIQLPRLRTLKLSDNLGIEDISALLARAPELTSLAKVSNVASLFKGNNLKKLKTLNLVGELTRDDLKAIAAAAPNLEELDLSQCLYQPDENIWFKLEDVKFSKLKKIHPPMRRNTAESLDIIETTTPALIRVKYLDVRDDLTDDVRPDQRKKLQDLGVIFSSDLPGPEREENIPSPPKKFSPADFEEPKGPPPTFNCFEHFPGVHPSKYRLSVWQPNLDTLDRQPTFNPTDFKPATLKQKPQKPFSRLQPGIKEVTYAEGKDIILPSLETDETDEELFDLQIFDNKGRRVKPEGFSYSKSTNFSRVTLPAKGEYVIKYQLALSDPTKKPPLPPEIDALQRKYRPDDKPQQKLSADEKELPLVPVETLRDVAKNVRIRYANKRHHLVRCEERCYAAYEDLEKEYKENVRIAFNAGHAIIELKNGEYWYPLDLGGTPGHYQPTKPLYPHVTERKESKAIASETVRYTPPVLFPITDVPFTTAIKQTTPTLFVATDDSNVRELYTTLRKNYSSEDIFPVHKPDELSLTRQSMTHDGKIRPENLFKQWLKKYIQNPNKKGIICVDIRTLEADALAQLNDLLDGKLENEQIPKNVRVVLVDKAVRGDYAADFRSRVPHKTIIPTPKEELLPEKPEEKETKDDVVEIDLFQSPYWDRILLGSYKYEATDEPDTFSLHWKKGQLFKAMDAKEIIFKNPPPNFTAFIAELQSLRLLRWADKVTSFPEHIKFYQRNGYDWQRLSKGTSLHPIKFGGDNAVPLVLSNTNILSFIENPAIHFSNKTGQLTKNPSHLKQKEATTIEVICTPDLTAGSLAQFLTAAQKRNITVRFHTPDPDALPDSSPLKFLFKSDRALESKEKFTPSKNPHVNFQISDDVEFTAMLLAEKNRDTIKLDISALDNSELGRVPAFDEKAKAYLKATGKLKMGSTLANIVTHLTAGKNVILYGDIPNSIYENLTALTLGEFEGQRFSGTLTIITSPQKANVVSALTGQTPPTQSPPLSEKIAALEKRYPGAVDNFDFKEAKSDMTYATLERNLLHHQITSNRPPESKTTLTDEQKADNFDQVRLQDTLLALHLNPWGMIAGATGIGKSHFLNEILPKHIKTVYNLEEWLTAKPPKGQKLALIMDEASFLSQLSGEGPNLLERFKSLKNKPPGFMWKGRYHILTNEHKALFSFNPASYGAGRSTQGFLTEQALSIPFQRLPDFYIRARLTSPLFKEVLPDIYLSELPKITAPLIDVFRWINNEYQKENLITAREIRLMINIIASHLHRYLPTKLDVDTVVNLAKEAANFVGRQTLGEESELLERFDKNFSLSSHVLGDRSVPEKIALHLMTDARQFLLERKSTQTITDLGLGGIVLEGPESVCKSTIEEWADKHKKSTGQEICRISSNVPYLEKEKLLREAFDEGAPVIVIGLNSSDWPNRMLNNFLMGVDEKNQKAKKPGFLLLGTQRTPSELGCHPEDPALRRRLIKLNVDRAPYEKIGLAETPEALKTQGLFAVTAAASAGDSKTPQGRPQPP